MSLGYSRAIKQAMVQLVLDLFQQDGIPTRLESLNVTEMKVYDQKSNTVYVKVMWSGSIPKYYTIKITESY